MFNLKRGLYLLRTQKGKCVGCKKMNFLENDAKGWRKARATLVESPGNFGAWPLLRASQERISENMRTLSRKFVVLLALVVASGLLASAFAQKAAKTKASKKTTKATPVATKFLAKGDGIETCIVTGEKLESKNIKGEFFGREVYFCCADCLAQAQKNPAAYVKKTEAEQLTAVKAVLAKSGNSHGDHHGDHHATPAKEAGKFLGKGDGIETCPVTGEAISKDVSVEVEGRTVYACCPGCLDKIKKNPELYLKPTNK